MKPYADYKFSDVEWIGDIPTHWQTIKVKNLFKRVKRTGYESEELLSVYRDYGVIPKSSRDDNHNKASDDLSPYQLVCNNNIVINKMKAWQGSLGVSDYRGIVSPAYHVYQAKLDTFNRVLPRYVHFLLRHPIYITQYMVRSKGIRVNQWDIEPDQFREIELLVPSIGEQRNIIALLDKETVRIDELIIEKENFIKLLEEKRQALISHVVTKGLDDSVKKKDSGVEIIGIVAESYAMLRFRYLFKFGRGLSITRDNLEDSGVKVVNYGEIHSKYNFELDTSRDELKYVNEKYLETNEECLVSKGDFIFADTSEDLDGAGNFTHIVSEEAIFAGYHTVVCKLKSSVNDARFLSYFIDSSVFRYQVQSVMKGVKVFSISQKVLKDIWLVLPPLNEQKEIASLLDKKTQQINALTDDTKKTILLLEERRKALISAAVTGKIDVREEV